MATIQNCGPAGMRERTAALVFSGSGPGRNLALRGRNAQTFAGSETYALVEPSAETKTALCEGFLTIPFADSRLSARFAPEARDCRKRCDFADSLRVS